MEARKQQQWWTLHATITPHLSQWHWLMWCQDKSATSMNANTIKWHDNTTTITEAPWQQLWWNNLATTTSSLPSQLPNTSSHIIATTRTVRRIPSIALQSLLTLRPTTRLMMLRHIINLTSYASNQLQSLSTLQPTTWRCINSTLQSTLCHIINLPSYASTQLCNLQLDAATINTRLYNHLSVIYNWTRHSNDKPLDAAINSTTSLQHDLCYYELYNHIHTCN